MTKDETNFFKGVALLMMLFVHSNSSQLISLMDIGGQSIWSFFYMANTPVALFLLLSGYGFYEVSCKGNDRNYLFRLVKLFIHFWLILLIMLPLTKKDAPLDAATVISNVTGWHVSWNGTCWFIFPYAILALTYRKIFALGNKFGWVIVLTVSFVLYLIAGFLVSRNAVTYSSSAPYIYNSLYLLMSQFPFVLGMALNKYKRKLIGRTIEEPGMAGSSSTVDRVMSTWGGHFWCY